MMKPALLLSTPRESTELNHGRPRPAGPELRSRYPPAPRLPSAARAAAGWAEPRIQGVAPARSVGCGSPLPGPRPQPSGEQPLRSVLGRQDTWIAPGWAWPDEIAPNPFDIKRTAPTRDRVIYYPAVRLPASSTSFPCLVISQLPAQACPLWPHTWSPTAPRNTKRPLSGCAHEAGQRA